MSQADAKQRQAEVLKDAIEKSLQNSEIFKYIRKIWVFNNKKTVIEFVYRRVHFAFDFTILDASLLSVDLVCRGKQNPNFSVTQTGKKKECLAAEIDFDGAIAVVRTRISKIFASVDVRRKENNQTVPTGEAVLSVTQSWQEMTGKPKVGILTLPLSKNIGGNLQAYALMQTLRRIGCEPILINRRYAAGSAGSQSKSSVSSDLITNKIEIETPCENSNFIEKNILPITRTFRSSAQLRNRFAELGLDAVISGSDQVWRAKYARGLLLDFFHGYLPDTGHAVKRISYAASFGSENWEFDERQTKEAAKLAQLFDAVSVREDSAVNLCGEMLSVNASHVLDPTLLLGAEQYFSLIDRHAIRSQKKYLVSYVLNPSEEKSRILCDVAVRLSLAISPAGAQGDAEKDKSVEGWLTSFFNSDFVVTDSFHGVAFSIIFNKPFIAFGNPERGMARFTSILKMFGLEDRLIVDSNRADVEKLLRPINWQRVNERLHYLRIQSVQFLKAALGMPVLEPSGGGSDPIEVPNGPAQETPKAEPGKVVKATLCTGCGVCVSEAGGAVSMRWSADGFWAAHSVAEKFPVAAKRVCPFNPSPEIEVKDEDALGTMFFPEAPNMHPRGGRFHNSYIGYSNKFRPTASSGGMATYVFNELLERNCVDSIYVVVGDRDEGYRYRMFKKGGDIDKISKTRYFPVTLEDLFYIIESSSGRVGVSGVACFIKAIRLKQHYHPELKAKIPFLVGIICGGLKSRFYTDYLAQSAGINGKYHSAQYRVKNPDGEANDYFFSAIDEDAKTKKVRMRKLGDMWGSGLFKNKACDFCTDVLTELADISLGDAWIPEYNKDGMGNSVVVTRSEMADRIIVDGIASGKLTMKEAPIDLVIRSQSGGLNHKQNALKFRTWVSREHADFALPAYRSRVEKEVPAADMLVQVLRERVRAKSLKYWREGGGDARLFSRRMQSVREQLKNVTAARKSDGAEVFRALLLAIESPDHHVSEDVAAPIQVLVRWFRLHVKAQRVNFEQLLHILPQQQSDRLAEALR